MEAVRGRLTMENRKLSFLLVTMMALIVALFWFTVYLGQDEFEAYQEEEEEEIEGPERTTDEEGLTIIQLSQAVQKNSGIETSLTKPSSIQQQLSAYGEVISIAPLIQAKREYAALKAKLTLAQSTLQQHQQKYEQLKALNADDKSVSDQSVNDALVTLKANQADITLAKSNLASFKQTTKLTWGNTLSRLLDNISGKPYFTGLLNHQYALIRVSLPVNSPTPKKGNTLFVSPIGNEETTINAHYIAPAYQGDRSGLGETYYYSAPGAQLREGMRVSVLTKEHEDDYLNGSIIPNAAVVWYAGTPWVYVKRNSESFLRKPIVADTEVGNGWFDQHFPVGTEIVTTGAQLLLSEEFKYIIQNENDD